MSSSSELRPVDRRLWLGYLCAVAVVVLWSAFSLAGRYAALAPGPRLTPWDLAGLRYCVATPIAIAATLAGPGRIGNWRRSVAVAVLAGLAFPLPAYVGFTFAPVAHAAVIMSGTMPFFIVGFLAMMGLERWTRARLQSLLVLVIGIALLGYAAYIQGSRPGAWRGDLLFVASSIAWSGFTVLARRWALTPWQVVGTVGTWGGTAFLLVWLVALPSHVSQVPVSASVFQAVTQGLLVTIASVLLFTRALALIGPARTAMVTALVPGVAGVLSAPLLGEEIGLLDLAGLVLVCAAVALGVRRTPVG